MSKPKAVFNWSGGKDSAHALLKALASGEYEIIALLTTVNADTGCSTMHDIPIAILERQASSIGIPLYVVGLAPQCGIDNYSAAMAQAVEHFKSKGVTHFIFGDIFLHDVRSYRERQLARCGIEVVEPLWGKSSAEVMDEFLASGLKATIVTTGEELGRDAIGRLIDTEFIASLPASVDPNGENGEYHTLCHDGPIFSHPIPFNITQPVSKSYDIGLDDGTTRTFTYWFTHIS